MEQFDGTVNAGRKGVAYDWQTLLAAAESASLESELARLALTPQFAE
jgi:aminoglycoside phosphotransferase